MIPGRRLLIEQGPGDVIAFGPLLGPGEDACIRCFAARRAACSGTGVGLLRMVTADAASLPAAADLLLEHQLRAGPSGALRDRFVPLPGCRCVRSGTVGGNIDELVSERLGLISRVWSFQEIPDLVTAVAEGAATCGMAGAVLPVRGSATAADPATARRHAISEALERYAVGFWAEDSLLGPASDPVVPAMLIANGKTVQVPARCIFQPFRDGASEPLDASGLAAGATAAEATDRAVAERVERNVIADLLVGSGTARRLPGRFDQIELVLAHSQDRYVCASLRAGAATPPHATIGFGAARRLDEALAKAQAERFHVEAHMRNLARKPFVSTSICSAVDRLVHALAFGGPLGTALLAQILNAPILEGRIPQVAERKSIAVVDVTTPDLRRFGIIVMRAVNIAD